MDMTRGNLGCEIREVAPRTLRFIGTDETLDRYNTIIKAGGWRMGSFSKNPVFLWCHEAGQPPIGKVVRSEATTVKRDARSVNALAFDVEFAPADVYPFADTIYKLYQGGFMRAVSVGFKNLKRRELSEDERKDLGIEGPATVLEENELYELSAVPVPGNPNALVGELAELCEARGVSFRTPEKEVSEEWLKVALESIRQKLDDRADPDVIGIYEDLTRQDVEDAVALALADLEVRVLARLEEIDRKLDVMRLRDAQSRVSGSHDDYGNDPAIEAGLKRIIENLKRGRE